MSPLVIVRENDIIYNVITYVMSCRYGTLTSVGALLIRRIGAIVAAPALLIESVCDV